MLPTMVETYTAEKMIKHLKRIGYIFVMPIKIKPNIFIKLIKIMYIKKFKQKMVGQINQKN